MSELINYIKKCYKTILMTELLECFPFDFDIKNILNMKNDGIFIIYNPDISVINICKYNSVDIEFINIGNIIIGRRTIKQIQWLDGDIINFPLSNDFLFKRILPTDFFPIRYETLDHTLVIESIIKNTHQSFLNLYIEYGTRDNKNFNVISKLVTKAIGVDMNPLKQHPDIYVDNTDHFSQVTLPQIIKKTFTEKITEDLRLRFNYAFIDADHSSKSAFTDFTNIFRYLEVGGYIFLHDTYPCDISFLDINACHDCYKTPLLIKEKFFKSINILTLPLNPGITIVQKIA
jgi:hypothetical protein